MQWRFWKFYARRRKGEEGSKGRRRQHQQHQHPQALVSAGQASVRTWPWPLADTRRHSRRPPRHADEPQRPQDDSQPPGQPQVGADGDTADANTAARRAKLSAMKGAFQLGITEIKQEAEADRAARAAQAALEYVELKQGVNDAWDSGKWDECKQALDKCLELNGDSDVLHNYRARVFDKKDMVREMVEDAKRAVELWSCTENLLLLSRCLQEAKKHSESGQNYLHASDRGDGSMPQITEGYNGLLKTIRRIAASSTAALPSRRRCSTWTPRS